MGSKVPAKVSCKDFASKSLRRAINAKIRERIFEAFHTLKAESFHEHRVLAHLVIFVLLQWGENVQWWLECLKIIHIISYFVFFFCWFYVVVRTQLLVTHR